MHVGALGMQNSTFDPTRPLLLSLGQNDLEDDAEEAVLADVLADEGDGGIRIASSVLSSFKSSLPATIMEV